MKLAGLALLAASPALAAANGFLLRGATIHTVSGADLPNAMLLVEEGKIVAVGSRIAAPRGVRILDLRGLHIYPGMIDSATEIGLSEISSVREGNDVTELGLFKPQLRAAIAVNPSSEHIPVTRANGITSVVTLPQGGIVAGQAALIHLNGWTAEEMTVLPAAALRIEFPRIRTAATSRSFRAPTRIPYAQARRRYQDEMRQLEEFFEEARRYQRAKAAGGTGFHTDLKFEAMLPVLARRLPVLIEADREKVIREALQFAEKQNLRMILEAGEDVWKFASALKAKGVPVILGRTLSLPAEEDEPYDRVFTTPGELFKAGVKFAFSTHGPSAGGGNPRNLPYEAAAAVPFGLPREEALKAVTLSAAQIWGVADRMGSIEEGKWADLIVTDGDPLEIRTQIQQVFIRGVSVDLDNKHHRLYEKYLHRPD